MNRTVKIDALNDEMTLEADTKLVEYALETMKLNGAKGVDSPRVRRTEEQTAQIENSEKLTSAQSTLYRSLVMKLAYVAQDRVDICSFSFLVLFCFSFQFFFLEFFPKKKRFFF